MKGIRALFLPYAVAVLAVESALILTFWLQSLLTPTLFQLFFAAVVVSTKYGGAKPGLLATALSTVAIAYFFTQPVLSHFLRLGVFVVGTILMNLLSYRLRNTQQCLEISIAKLQESEEKFRCLIDSNIIGVIVADLSGEIVEANDAFLQMVGYSPEDLHFRRVQLREMCAHNYLELSQHSIIELKTTGMCKPFEKEYIRKDGTCIPILLDSVLLESNPELAIAFVVDLRLREQLLQAVASLRKPELRTSLNAMLGWMQLLRNRKLDETACTLLSIDRNTKSLKAFIEDALDVSLIVMGKMRLNVRPIELVPIVEAVIKNVLPMAEAKSIDLAFSICDLELENTKLCLTSTPNDNRDAFAVPSMIVCKIPKPKFIVLADVNHLQQIVLNLLSNAIKFTAKGGRVDVQLEQVASHIQIQVRDTGKGISPDFLPYIFERFRQAGNFSRRSHGRLELGLVIVRHLVELHGGKVCAESLGVGLGATFTVNLPLFCS